MPLVHAHGTTTRVSDSSPRLSFSVTEDPDGDVWVAILCDGLPLEVRVGEEYVRARIEFVVSHPRSQHLISALRDARVAMKKDNAERPIDLR